MAEFDADQEGGETAGHPVAGAEMLDMAAGSRGTYARSQERVGRLSVIQKLLYALGEMPGQHMNFAIGSFIMLYYNQILGLSSTMVAVAGGLALLLDSASDPFVGAFSDRFKSRLGRRHPFMYAAAVPLGFFIYLLFAPPAGLSEILLIAWLVSFLILTRQAFTVFSVPWSALTPELAVDYQDRTSLASYRALIATVCGGLAGFLFFNLVFAASPGSEQGQLNPENYAFFAPLIGILITLWCLASAYFTRKQVPYLLQPAVTTRASFSDMLRAIMLALRGSNYQIVLGGLLIYFGIASTLATFDMLVSTYFWRLSGEQLGFISVAMIIGPISAFIVAPRLQPAFQKHHVLCAALFVQMLLSLVSVSMRLGGFFPENESPLFLPLLSSFAVVQAFVQALTMIMLLSMIPDLVDEQEYRVGERQEGVFSAGVATATKAVGSVGLIVSGVLLDTFIGLEPGSANTEIAEDVIVRLAITDAVIVNAFILIPIYLLSRYTLTSERLTQIQIELAKRRG